MIVVVLAILQLPNASGSPIFKRIGVPSKIVSRVSPPIHRVIECNSLFNSQNA
jgi:hypothetical protein